MKRQIILLALTAVLLTAGCSHQIEAQRSSTKAVYKQMEINAVNSGEPSAETMALLHRYNLADLAKKRGDEALRALHFKAVATGDRDLLFALAETSFLTGEQVRKGVKVRDPRDQRDYYLGAAVYAYLFLFSEPTNGAPNGFDRRFRTACDLYNFGLGLAMVQPKDTNAVTHLVAGKRRLPVGEINLQLDVSKLEWKLDEIQQFILADQFVVHGLSERNRQSGLGANLIGVRLQALGGAVRPMAPATAFLRVEGGLEKQTAGDFKGSLEMHSAFGSGTAAVGNQDVPLEMDWSAHTAYAMNQSIVWQLEKLQFLSLKEIIPNGVYLSQPYQKGLIPVVFVHGTYSSPVHWAEMLNTLRSDPAIRQRYQFWYFIYNSSGSMLRSAQKLRDSLEARVKELDPDGTDPALRQMVLVGHSQGGLLVKMVSTDTGDAIWNSFSDKPIDDIKATDEQKAEIKRLFVLKPEPTVRRVVFVATPHRGSYRAGGMIRALARWAVSMPSNLAERAKEAGELAMQLKLPKGFTARKLTSIDGMSTRNPALKKMADIPVGPDIKAHSIIPVKGKGDFRDGTDGVVKYQSAHLDGVESELIVRYKHSCQSTPEAIEEVRRILYVHLAGQKTQAAASEPK